MLVILNSLINLKSGLISGYHFIFKKENGVHVNREENEGKGKINAFACPWA